MTLLCDLAKKYGTDKGAQENGGWGYTPIYDQVLAPIRDQVRNVLEVGICGFRDIPNNVVGASLFMWKDYFPNAVIHGLDNDSRFVFNDQHRIATALCDAYAPTSLGDALKLFGEPVPHFEFICDDAVHEPLEQVHLFNMLWPFLTPGGVYAIEDVCPTKCWGSELGHMIHLMLGSHDDVVQVREFTTHKAERLLLAFKA